MPNWEITEQQAISYLKTGSRVLQRGLVQRQVNRVEIKEDHFFLDAVAIDSSKKIMVETFWGLIGANNLVITRRQHKIKKRPWAGEVGD